MKMAHKCTDDDLTWDLCRWSCRACKKPRLPDIWQLRAYNAGLRDGRESRTTDREWADRLRAFEQAMHNLSKLPVTSDLCNAGNVVR